MRRALLEAGTELAREGGPLAVVLREATRRAGVVPNAAYRHFASRQELLEAVRAAALADLARTMEAELATINPALPAVEQARASLRAVGLGYLRYALAEPGLFRTAFAFSETPEGDSDLAKAGSSGLNPFQLLDPPWTEWPRLASWTPWLGQVPSSWLGQRCMALPC